MKSRKGVPAVLAVAALLGSPAAASAHQVSRPTAVVLEDDVVAVPGTRSLAGHLETTRACRSDRRIEVFARYGEWTPRHVWGPGDWTLVDEARSSAAGEFAASTSDSDLIAARVRAKRSTVLRRGHRHVCRAGAADRAY